MHHLFKTEPQRIADVEVGTILESRCLEQCDAQTKHIRPAPVTNRVDSALHHRALHLLGSQVNISFNLFNNLLEIGELTRERVNSQNSY